MTPQQEIDVLRHRLERAEARRDAWRAAGHGERYREAYSWVEALEQQIDRRLGAGTSAVHADTVPGYLSR